MTQRAILVAANLPTSPGNPAENNASDELLAFIEFLGHALAEKWCSEIGLDDDQVHDTNPNSQYSNTDQLILTPNGCEL
jgi:hypothetical protein